LLHAFHTYLTFFVHLTAGNGKEHTLDLHSKWSTTIVKELMDVAGGASWTQWKAQATVSGHPLVSGEEVRGRAVKKMPPRLSLWKKPTRPEIAPSNGQRVVEESSQADEKVVGRLLPRPQSGAAAVLP
jgi:hypothetical protein